MATPTTLVPSAPPDEVAQAALARAVMRRQGALGVRVAALFLVLLFGLPLVNWLLPQVAAAPVGGFTLSWLVLGVLFYPLTWLLSLWFIRASDRIETDLARQYPAAREKGEGAAR